MNYGDCLLLIVLSYVFVVDVYASSGDRSFSFNKCLQKCVRNCPLEGPGTILERSLFGEEKFSSTQPLYLRLLGWDCAAECRYSCMWKTVHDFQLDGSRIPQFYGKWPFIRILGVQEPASTIFSALNGLSHIVMLRYFRARVSSTAPCYYLWHFYAAVNINTWLWSTIFHTRDTDFTEKMDYFSAFATVLVSLFTGCVRIASPAKHFLVGCCTAVVLVLFYAYHVHFLAFVTFSYSYNMKANVTAGLTNAAAWLIWSWRVHRQQPYVWKAAATIISVLVLLLLELGDFPPVWWTFDAHSLWHAGTILLPLLWYRFLVDDCRFLMKQKQTASSLDVLKIQ